MKTITPPLLKFSLVATVLTIAFRFFLSYGIGNKMTVMVLLTAVLYGLGLLIAGWFLVKKMESIFLYMILVSGFTYQII